MNYAVPPPADGTGPPQAGLIPVARPILLDPSVPFAVPVHPFVLSELTAPQAWADVGIALLLAVPLMLLGEVVIGTVLGVISGVSVLDEASMPPEIRRQLLYPVLGMRAAISVLVVAAIVQWRRGTARSVGVTSDRLALDGLLGVATVIATSALIWLVMLALLFLYPATLQQFEENSRRIMDLLPRIGPLGLAGLAVTVGVYEELLFRGFLMPRLRRGTGSWIVAVLISSTIFTALHALDQTPAALVMVAILSLMFSGVTVWRRSIIPAAVAHTLFNLGQFLILYYSAGDAWT